MPPHDIAPSPVAADTYHYLVEVLRDLRARGLLSMSDEQATRYANDRVQRLRRPLLPPLRLPPALPVPPAEMTLVELAVLEELLDLFEWERNEERLRVTDEALAEHAYEEALGMARHIHKTVGYFVEDRRPLRTLVRPIDE